MCVTLPNRSWQTAPRPNGRSAAGPAVSRPGPTLDRRWAGLSGWASGERVSGRAEPWRHRRRRWVLRPRVVRVGPGGRPVVAGDPLAVGTALGALLAMAVVATLLAGGHERGRTGSRPAAPERQP